MDLNLLINNITKKEEYDPEALEIQYFIMKHAEECENPVKWSPSYSVREEEKQLLLRHGYSLETKEVREDWEFCGISDYEDYVFIGFGKNGTCKSDKRMMSAGEMYEVYEKALIKKQNKENEEIRKKAYEVFNGPSHTTKETPTHYVKSYNYYGKCYYPIFIQVVEELKKKLPGVYAQVDVYNCLIILNIPKNLIQPV